MISDTTVRHHINSNKHATVKAFNDVGIFYRYFYIVLGSVTVVVHPDQARRLRDSIDAELSKPGPPEDILHNEDWLYYGSEKENQ